MAASVALVASGAAHATISLMGVPAAGIVLNDIRVGQYVTFNYFIGGQPGEQITGGGDVNVLHSSNLGEADIRFADSAFDDASTNPLVFSLDFKALAAGPAYVTATFAGLGSTTGTLDISAPRIAFDVVASTPETGTSVPEMATWAMMVGGFGIAGLAMRRRRRALPLVVVQTEQAGDRRVCGS